MQFSIEQFTGKQQRFILAYCKTQHATNSAIEAGIRPSNASSQGAKWLANSRIKAEIAKRLADRLDRYYVAPEKIIREMALMAFSNLDDFIKFTEDNQASIDFEGVTKAQMAGLTEIVSEELRSRDGSSSVVRTKIKLADKRAALMDLAKLIKMLGPEQVEHQHTGQITHAHAHVVLNPREMSAHQRALLKTALLALEAPPTDEPAIDHEEDDDAGDHEAR